ncbi:MAG: class I SAM-dependent methyltransferase [Gammaproteobacteria bacterium]
MSDKTQHPRLTRFTRTPDFVPESRFGFWFLGTRTWECEVVRDAFERLAPLIRRPRTRYPVVLDAGCGQGMAFSLLQERLQSRRLIGLDRDTGVLARARRLTATRGLHVELLKGDCAALPLQDACVDLVFCHQTFHHLVRQERVLREFHRVLKPGGVLLFAESTIEYIDTWVIRLLFRHPAASQRTAAEFLAMLRYAGFAFDERNLQFPYLWWSRTTFKGVLEILHLRPTPARGARKETLVYAAVTKPATGSQS